MNVQVCYGQTDRRTICGVEVRGSVYLSFYTYETLARWRKLEAEVIAGQVLANVRR